jgi:hypothetical protein
MIDLALLSDSQRRLFPPPAARRSSKPLPAQDRQSLSKRRACLRRSQHPRQKSPSSSLPPRTIFAASPRTPASASSANPKSP